MNEFLWRLVPWGVDVIVALQASLGHNLDPLFRAITLLGDAYVYVAVTLALLWQDDSGRVQRLAVLLLLSLYVNQVLKAAFGIPRPFVVSGAVEAKADATGLAFPSGHAQGVTALWLGLAVVYRKRWPLLAGAAIIPAVAFSRIYLGVHYPQDIVGGALVGATLAGLYALLEPRFTHWSRRQPDGLRVSLGIVLPLALAAATTDGDAQLVAGGLMGLTLGQTLASRWLGALHPAPGLRAAVLRTIYGAAATGVVFIMPILLSLALVRGWDPPALVRVLHAAFTGATISLGAPWLFVRSGLNASAGG